MSSTEQTFFLRSGPARDLSHVVETLHSLPEDKAFKVTIAQRQPRRTIEQNAYLWGVVYPTILKNLQGWDADDLHEYCLGEWSGWEKVTAFGRTRLRPIKRSSSLSVSDFMKFIDFIQRRMAEHGIVIPEADPEWRDHREAS